MKSKRIALITIFICGAISHSATASRSSDPTIEIAEINSIDEAKACEVRALAGDQVSMLRLWRYAAMEQNNQTESTGWLWLASKHGNAFARKELIRLCKSKQDFECVAQWSHDSQ